MLVAQTAQTLLDQNIISVFTSALSRIHLFAYRAHYFLGEEIRKEKTAIPWPFLRPNVTVNFSIRKVILKWLNKCTSLRKEVNRTQQVLLCSISWSVCNVILRKTESAYKMLFKYFSILLLQCIFYPAASNGLPAVRQKSLPSFYREKQQMRSCSKDAREWSVWQAMKRARTGYLPDANLPQLHMSISSRTICLTITQSPFGIITWGSAAWLCQVLTTGQKKTPNCFRTYKETHQGTLARAPGHSLKEISCLYLLKKKG